MQTARILSHHTVLPAADDIVRASDQRLRRDGRHRVPVSQSVSADAEVRLTGAEISLPLHHGFIRNARSTDKKADHLKLLAHDRDKRVGLKSYDSQRQS